MPKPFPREFREDVVRVAMNRDPGVSLRRIAADFGISETCLQNWVRQAAKETGPTSVPTGTEESEARELRRRVKLLEQENEILRRAAAYFAQAHLPGK